MPEMLTQKDLDALILSLVADEPEPGAKRPDSVSQHHRRLVRVYDFKRPDKFSRDQIRTVEMLHENIGRQCSTYLAAQVRAMASCTVSSVDQMTFEEFTKLLPNPSFVATVNMEPLKGNMFIALDIAIALVMVDRLFGGPGVPVGSSRPLTEIETAIVERLTNGILSQVRECWGSLVAVDPKIEATTSNPSFIQNIGANEMSVVVRYDIKIGKTLGSLILCIPFVTMEPVLPKLSAKNWLTVLRQKTQGADTGAVMKRLVAVDLDLVASLGKTALTVREILDLEPGDVIRLDSRVTDEISVYVASRLKFLAIPGRVGKMLCFQVSRVLKEDDVRG